jgi:hypothetical protein
MYEFVCMCVCVCVCVFVKEEDKERETLEYQALWKEIENSRWVTYWRK